MSIVDLQLGLDTVWVLIAAFLVFFMQAGFGMVEAGFIRAKNATNILTKNFIDFCMASIGFFAFGYALMDCYFGPWMRAAERIRRNLSGCYFRDQSPQQDTDRYCR